MNQLDDNDDFFERELSTAATNPLDNPQVKPKSKDNNLRSSKESLKFGNDDLLNEILSSEGITDTGLNSTGDLNAPKVLSLKNQKGRDISPIISDQGQNSFSSSVTAGTRDSPTLTNTSTKSASGEE